MANFTPSKKTPQDFNDGVQYVNQDLANNIQGDEVQADTINNLVESALYSQDQAESAKQTAENALSQVDLVIEDKTLLPEVRKNFYNLGAYDTYVSNGDGTGTVLRKTEYSVIDGVSIKIVGKSSVYDRTYYSNFYPMIDIEVANDSAVPPMSASVEVGAYADLRNKTSVSVGIGSGGDFAVGFPVSSGVSNVDEANKYLSENPIYVKYRVKNNYQYPEPVIENQPIRPASQEQEMYWNAEWKKGLNLIGFLERSDTKNGVTATINEDGTISLLGTASANGYLYLKIRTIKSNTTYTFVNNLNVRAGIDDSLEGSVISAYGNKTSTATFSTDGVTVWIQVKSGMTYNETGNIMLVRGSHAYPYEPYYGGIVREKDLSGVQLFPEGVNPAQTIGGDWEDKGTITTSNSTVLHAYRRL